MKVVVLVDGEHHPPVVRAAIDHLRAGGDDVVAGVHCGGTEKLGTGDLSDAYGVGVERGAPAHELLSRVLERERPDAVVDLSDEPVLGPVERFRLAALTLYRGAEYLGPDFRLEPVRFADVLTKPSVAVFATAKRTGKTAVAGALARRAVERGRHPVIVAMGRGGPPEPVVLEVGTGLDVHALVAMADAGRHAASDYVEDALTSRVTTIGCRRVGGGLAGVPFLSTVAEGARLAEQRPEDLVIVEGSGAVVPPVGTAVRVVCVPATTPPDVLGGYLNPYRLLLADVAVVTIAEERTAAAQVEAALRQLSPGIEVLRTTFRPKPLTTVAGRRVFFCCTAPPDAGPVLRKHLERTYGCEVVGMSHHLSEPAVLVDELRGAPDHDVLLTELKAAAVEVASRSALQAGHEVAFADNALHGEGVDEALDRILTASGAG